VNSVLVVDDEIDIRQAVAEVLADEGYQVFDAGDGAEALRKCRAHHPSIVLLDLMMPRMNGWEFRDAQKHDPDVSAIPVVVVSALGRVSNIDAEGFIQKPFDLDELLAMVRRHARRSDAGGGAPAPRS
jgi:DNA-binding response OmpR family regulator